MNDVIPTKTLARVRIGKLEHIADYDSESVLQVLRLLCSFLLEINNRNLAYDRGAFMQVLKAWAGSGQRRVVTITQNIQNQSISREDPLPELEEITEVIEPYVIGSFVPVLTHLSLTSVVLDVQVLDIKNDTAIIALAIRHLLESHPTDAHRVTFT